MIQLNLIYFHEKEKLEIIWNQLKIVQAFAGQLTHQQKLLENIKTWLTVSNQIVKSLSVVLQKVLFF